MISFPILYDNEILYSGLARYFIRSGNIKAIHSLEDLFGTRNCTASFEMPTNIDALIGNMPVNTEYTADYLINNHTLFPFYAALIKQDRREKIKQIMRSWGGPVSYMSMGLVSSSVKLNQYIRFCPECFEENYETYGEAYWDRSHQVSGLFVCLKHKVPLKNSTVLIRAGYRQKYINADRENCKVVNEVCYDNDLTKKMIWMAEDIDLLFNNHMRCISPEDFSDNVRIKLIELGYARMNNYIHQNKLRDDFISFYGEEYLRLMQSEVIKDSSSWLSTMVHNSGIATYPTRYLLLARFLNIEISTLFSSENDTNEKDGISAMEEYRDLWDQRLIELSRMSLSIRNIAEILGASTKTVRKSIDRLGIEPFWKFNGGGRYLHEKYPETKDFGEKKKSLRDKWQELHLENPRMSSNQIRKNNDGVYSWLSKYDADWLHRNYRTINSRKSRVDWSKRDEELLPKVKEVVSIMTNTNIERITWTSIQNKLGIGWLRKRREKLPLTSEYIRQVEENQHYYHIRKIKWAIELLMKENRQITFWNLIEAAGVKERFIEGDLLKEVKSLLKEKGIVIDSIENRSAE